MALPRVWVPAVDSEIFGDAYRHIATVLRLKAGTRLRAICGDGFEYEAEVSQVGPRSLRLRVVDRRPLATEVDVAVTLYQGLLKGDQMDEVVQKATELGVSRIVPLETERSIVRRGQARVDRWEKIAQGAAAQSGRGRVPVVTLPLTFQAALEEPRSETGFLFWEGEAQRRMSLPPGPVALFVGPEGGFSAAEASRAAERGIQVCTLGRRILRATTAAVAAVTLTMHHLGEL